MRQFAELKALTMRAIGDVLEPRGYRYVKALAAFKKPNIFGSWHLQIATIRHSEDFDLSAGVAVRFDALQAFLFEGSANKRLAASSVSIGADLANIAGVGMMRWNVADGRDVAAASRGVIEAFDRFGQPYLLRYADPEAALRKLISDDADAWTLVPGIAHQWMTALALAHVLQHGELIDLIVARAEVAGAKDPNMAQFRALVERVRRHR